MTGQLDDICTGEIVLSVLRTSQMTHALSEATPDLFFMWCSISWCIRRYFYELDEASKVPVCFIIVVLIRSLLLAITSTRFSVGDKRW